MIFIFLRNIIFQENALSLKYNLEKKGYICEITYQFNYDSNNIYIIFGAHVLIEKFPDKYIIYQLEQSNVGYYNNENKYIDNNHITFNQKYINILQNSIEVWEYSKENIKFFEKINKELDKKIKYKYFPLCYSPTLSHFCNYKNINKNIDVLFFGTINKRRQGILEKLKSQNINIEVYSNLFGEERLCKILSSKIIVNIHFFENSLLETHRINYLLANKCFVISEYSRDTFEDNNYKDKIIFCKYNNIIDECLEWLNKDEERNKLSEDGFSNLKNMFDITNYIDNISENITSII